MKTCLQLLIILLLASSTMAQAPDKPFSGFDKLVHSCGEAQSIVESERKRFGVRFEKELLNYLGNDADKHYWMACSLSSCCRELNDRSLESLSLLIRQQALSLLKNKSDNHSRYTVVALHVLAAVQSEHLGFHSLAIAHKSEAERMVSDDPMLKGGLPALSEDDWRLYESLPKQPLRSQKIRKPTSKSRKK